MIAIERFGAPCQIRLWELCLRSIPGTERVIAVMMSGYFDDSRTEGEVLAIAGFVGIERKWKRFDKLWPAFLARHGVPYAHMKEMNSPSGPFAKWLPAKEHADELKSYFSDMDGTLHQSKFDRFGSIVRLRDLEKFNKENGLSLDPYALAIYACILHIKRRYFGAIINLFFDRFDHAKSRIDKGLEYAKTDRTDPGVTELIQPIPIQAGLTYQQVRPIQAADFLVWEIRKHNFEQSEWWDSLNVPTLGWSERFESYKSWSREKYGTNLPTPRKSLEALVRNSNVKGLMWDYPGLCIAHEARGGVWSLPSS